MKSLANNHIDEEPKLGVQSFSILPRLPCYRYLTVLVCIPRNKVVSLYETQNSRSSPCSINLPSLGVFSTCHSSFNSSSTSHPGPALVLHFLPQGEQSLWPYSYILLRSSSWKCSFDFHFTSAHSPCTLFPFAWLDSWISCIALHDTFVWNSLFWDQLHPVLYHM